MVQICRLENIEHKSMKQVSYGGKYSLIVSRAHHSHLQFSFVVGDGFCKLKLSQRIQRKEATASYTHRLIKDLNPTHPLL